MKGRSLYILLILVHLLLLLNACTSETVNRDPMVNLAGITSGEIKLADLNRVLRQNQNNAGLYAKRAKLYLQDKQYEKALTDIEKAIYLNDNQEEYYFWKAAILREMDRITLALATAEEAEQLGSKDINNYLLQTELLLRKSRFTDALQKVNIALAEDPDNEYGIFYKGMARAATNDTASAVLLFRRALRVAPDFLDSYLQLSSIFKAKKDYEQAKRYMQSGFRLDSLNGFLWYQQGLLYQSLHRADSAYYCFEKATKLNSDLYLAHYQLSLIQYKKADYNQAAAYMEKVKAAAPGLNLVQEILAESYEKTGRYKQALLEYNEILRRKPQDVRTMWGIRRSNYALYKLKRDSLNKYRHYQLIDTITY